MHPTLLLLFNALLLLLAGATAQTLHIVEVGRRGDALALRFTPEEIYADVGDLVQFQFYPVNHSVVESTFSNPCQPATNETSPLGTPFFSGFHPLPPDTKVLDTFTINITTDLPIFFYCSQGRHCQSGFVGAINPSENETFAAYKAAAREADKSLSPGETADVGASEDSTATNAAVVSRKGRGGSDSDDDDDDGVTNVGAIVGGVLGGLVFMILALTATLFAVLKRRARKKREPAVVMRRRIIPADIGKPRLESDSAGVFTQTLI